jgi:Cu+-exporting ATPase
METARTVVVSPVFEEARTANGPSIISELGIVVFVAVAALAGKLALWKPFLPFDVFSLAGALIGAVPIVREAIGALRQRRMTMELSMSIAILAALAIGELFTSAVIVLFVLVAEILEGLTVRRGDRAIEDLLPLLPEFVLLREGAATRRLPIRELLEKSLPGIRSSISRR